MGIFGRPEWVNWNKWRRRGYLGMMAGGVALFVYALYWGYCLLVEQFRW